MTTLRINAAERFVDRWVLEDRGNRIALLSENKAFTYEDVLELSMRAAGFLATSGVEAGDRLAIASADTPATIAVYWGAVRIGAVPVMLGNRLTAESYADAFADTRPDAAIVASDAMGAVLAARQRTRFPAVLLIDGEPVNDYPSAESVLASAQPVEVARRLPPDAPLMIQYTSGSTGQPKGVVITHDACLAQPAGLSKHLGLHADDLHFSAAKLSFGYGLLASLLYPFHNGAASVLQPALSDPHSLLRTISEFGPTLFFGVPSVYSGILDVLERGSAFDVQSVRIWYSAGEHLSRELFHRWHRTLHREIIDGIGGTECTHIFISNRPGVARAGSAGTVVPGDEILLLGDDGNSVPTGETGILRVRGPNAARYWNDPAGTRRTWIGGWVQTGDLFRCDDEGFFYYVGRKDDMIKVGAQKVYPQEVEAALLDIESVLEAAVVDYRAEGAASELAALVRVSGTNEDAHRAVRRIRVGLRVALPAFKRPRTILIVDEIPKTVTGKVDRGTARRLAAERSASQPPQ
jgi:4-hydroxybenzoate-CoA ligase